MRIQEDIFQSNKIIQMSFNEILQTALLIILVDRNLILREHYRIEIKYFKSIGAIPAAFRISLIILDSSRHCIKIKPLLIIKFPLNKHK